MTMTKTIPVTCDNWDTYYNSENWEPGFMTFFITWQLGVTLDSIRNSCDVLRNNMLDPNRCKYLKDYFFKATRELSWEIFSKIISINLDSLVFKKNRCNYWKEYFVKATTELSWERRITRSVTKLQHQFHTAHKVKCHDKINHKNQDQNLAF